MVDCPQKINWKITFRCNADMRCKFCYSPSIKTIQNKWIQICDTIIEHPPKLVVLAGGEPTTHPNFVDIVKKLHSNKIKICLATNGIDLVNIFPDFYKYINIISLPIEGEYYIHSKLRDKYSFIMCNLQNMLPQTLVRYETYSSRSNRIEFIRYIPTR